MVEQNLSGRLVEIESMLDRSRRRFDEGSKLVEEAHKLLGDIQQALIGSPRSMSPEDSEEAASKLLASLKATGGVPNIRFLLDKAEKHHALPNGDGAPNAVRGTFEDTGGDFIGRLLMRGTLPTVDEGTVSRPMVAASARSPAPARTCTSYCSPASL